MVKYEAVKDLGSINKALIKRLLERKYSDDEVAIPIIDYLTLQSKATPRSLPVPGITSRRNRQTGPLLPSLDLNFRKQTFGFRVWLAQDSNGSTPHSYTPD